MLLVAGFIPNLCLWQNQHDLTGKRTVSILQGGFFMLSNHKFTIYILDKKQAWRSTSKHNYHWGVSKQIIWKCTNKSPICQNVAPVPDLVALGGEGGELVFF